MLRLDGERHRFALGQAIAVPEAAQEIQPQLLPDCLLDHVAVAPAELRCAHLTARSTSSSIVSVVRTFAITARSITAPLAVGAHRGPRKRDRRTLCHDAPTWVRRSALRATLVGCRPHRLYRCGSGQLGCVRSRRLRGGVVSLAP